MSYFSKPVLVTFLGVPGSGKTYFARQAAERMQAVRLNSDAMRLSIFGSREKTKEIYHSQERNVLNSYVFGAMDYATEQILGRGADVLYDANSNSRQDRMHAKDIAEKHGAIAVLVWIKTPRDLAIKRGQSRDDDSDSPKKTEAEMINVIERMTANIDEPDETESYVIIDGQAVFDEQFAEFEARVLEIMNNADKTS